MGELKEENSAKKIQQNQELIEEPREANNSLEVQKT